MIPVYILTGFLGSGKTTILNQLLKSPQFSKTIVIINEFGEVGLDHLLVSVTSETIIEMSSGCICCTIRGDLQKTFNDILKLCKKKKGQQYERVIIETTGLADPAPIIHTLMTDASIVSGFELHGVIATIDTACFVSTQQNQFEAHKQAAMADCLLLTKTDIASKEKRESVVALLHTINPSARVLISENGAVSAEIFSSLTPFAISGREPDVLKWLNEEAYEAGHADHHAHDHMHDVNRHGTDISAFCITRTEPIPEKAFTLWIEALMKFLGAKMLRIKGIVNVEHYSGPVVLHSVQHIFYPLQVMNHWPDDDHRTRIVFITRGLKKEPVENSLQKLSMQREEVR